MADTLVVVVSPSGTSGYRPVTEGRDGEVPGTKGAETTALVPSSARTLDDWTTR